MQSNARAGTRVCLFFFRTHPIPELRIFRCLGHAPCVKAVLSESVDGINFAKGVLPPIDYGDGARYRYRSCGTATPRPPDINVALAGRSPICEIYSYPTPPHCSQAAPRNTSLILGERGGWFVMSLGRAIKDLRNSFRQQNTDKLQRWQSIDRQQRPTDTSQRSPPAAAFFKQAALGGMQEVATTLQVAHTFVDV